MAIARNVEIVVILLSISAYRQSAMHRSWRNKNGDSVLRPALEWEATVACSGTAGMSVVRREAVGRDSLHSSEMSRPRCHQPIEKAKSVEGTS